LTRIENKKREKERKQKKETFPALVMDVRNEDGMQS
jgi:hypothetical protein